MFIKYSCIGPSSGQKVRASPARVPRSHFPILSGKNFCTYQQWTGGKK